MSARASTHKIKFLSVPHGSWTHPQSMKMDRSASCCSLNDRNFDLCECVRGDGAAGSFHLIHECAKAK